MNNRKGQQDWASWQNIFTGIAAVIIVGIVVAILLQAMAGDASTMCQTGSHIYNATTNSCHSATNVSVTSAKTYAGNITNDGLTFVSNASDQYGTAGTVLGIAVVLVIFGAIGIWAYKKWDDS